MSAAQPVQRLAYTGTGLPSTPPPVIPDAPRWRRFAGTGVVDRPTADDGETDRRIGPLSPRRHLPAAGEVAMVNAAIYLRRPLLVTGAVGVGKSSLAYRIARELSLGPVLRWRITSSSTVRGGIVDGPDRPGADVRLGPLGTALLPGDRPRVLLVDELDRAQLDLAEEILAVLDAGECVLPEFTADTERRVATHDHGYHATIRDGVVRCREFPIVIITAAGEREFSPSVLRQCLRWEMPTPNAEQLLAILAAQLGEPVGVDVAQLVSEFLARSKDNGGLAIDQLLNAAQLRGWPDGDQRPELWHPLAEVE